MTLSSGLPADMAISDHTVAMRVGDRACLAAPRWMTRTEWATLTADMQTVLDGWPVDA